MKYCCEGLKGAAENAEKAGLSVVINNELANEQFFQLVFRSSSVGDDEIIMKHLKEKTDIPKLILGQQATIIYCPWCGKKLLKFYKKDLDSFSNAIL